MVIVENLVKTFQTKEGKVGAVDNISFKVAEGMFFTLLGPSGCGKTTTLRCIAGLERPISGRIQIGHQEVFSSFRNVHVPTSQRSIGMVFQSYAIWPHMTVFQNVVYPLRVKGVRRKDSNKEVMETLAIVGLEELSSRPATRLSGGQQQRVALARALVAKPKLLLLDEPLSNLDAKLRTQMRVELKKLQKQLGITTIYVTHDQQEALNMSDEILLMNKGRAMQQGAPEMIYSKPRNQFTAEFIGSTNIFPGRLTERAKPGIVSVETAYGRMRGILEAWMELHSDKVILSVRPEVLRINPIEERNKSNYLRGRVEHVSFCGDCMEHQVRVGENLIVVKDPQNSRFSVGTEVSLAFPCELCNVIAADVEQNVSVATDSDLQPAAVKS